MPRDFSKYMKDIEIRKNLEAAEKAIVDKKYIEAIQSLEENEKLLSESGNKEWFYYNTIYILAICHEHLKDYKKSKELYSQVIEGLHKLDMEESYMYDQAQYHIHEMEEIHME